MTRSLLVLTAAALLAGAVHAQVDPALKLSFAPMRELNEIFTRIVTIGGKPEKADQFNQQLKQMGMGEGAGIETTKRWGAFLDFPKDDLPKAALVVAVKDEKEFLAGMKPFYPQQEKDGERWKLVSQSAPPMIVHVKDGYAYVIPALVPAVAAAPTPFLKDAAKALEGEGTINLVIEAARLAADVKANLVTGLKKASGADQAPPDKQAEVDAKFAPMQAQADALNQVLEPFDRLTLAIKVSSTLPEVHIIATEIAKKVEGAKPETVAPSLGWITVVNDHGPGALEFDMPLVGRFRQMFEQGLTKLAAQAKAARDPKDHAAMDALVEEMNRLLKLGRLEGFIDAEGADGKLTVYCVARLADDSELAKKMEPILLKGPPSGEKAVKSEAGGTTYWAVASKPNDPSKIRSGGLAFGKGLAAFALSQDANATDQLKALVGKLAATKPNTEEGVKGFISVVGLTELGDPFDLKKTDAGKKQFEEMLATGRDESRLTITQNAEGHRMELSLQGYPVAMVYREMAKDKGAPGASPATVTPAPGAPASPEPAASPAPEASPEAPASPASPAAEEGNAEEEKPAEGEEEEKPKGLKRGIKKKDDDE